MSSQQQVMAAAGNLARPLPVFVSASTGDSSSSAPVVTAPSGIQNGDILIALSVINDNSTNISLSPATGFNQIYFYREPAANGGTFSISTKIAASESGSYTFTWSGSSSTGCTTTILVYRNATRVNVHGSYLFQTSSPISAGSVVPTYAGTVIAWFNYGGNGTVSSAPSGMTQRVYFSGSTSVAIYDLANQPVSPTSDYSLTWSSTGTSRAVQLFVTNEPDATPVYVASASTQNSASGTSLVINKPTGTVQNDLMVAVMAANGVTSWTGDTGWTEIADQVSVTPNLRVAYKIAGAAEGSSYTFTASASRTLSGCILTYRYADYDTVSGSFATSANPLVLTSISPSLSQSILIAVGVRAIASVTLGTPTSMTARVTDNDATAPSYIVCDQTVSKGPTGTRSISTASSTSVCGISLAIRPTSVSYPYPYLIGTNTTAITAASVTLTTPTGAASGDYLIISLNTANTNVVQTPSGWTLLTSQTGASPYTYVFGIKLTGTPAASYTVTLASGTAAFAASILCYRNANFAAASSQYNSPSSNSITAPSITAAQPGMLVCSFNSTNTLGITAPTNMTQQTSIISSGNSSLVADVLVAAGATGTKVATISSGSNSVGASILLTV